MKTIRSPLRAVSASDHTAFRPLANRRAGVATKLFCTVVIAALLPGCHTRVTSGIGFTEDQVAFIQPGMTRRDEVSRQLGYGGLNRPQWQWMHGQAIAYVWQTTNGAIGGFSPAADPSVLVSWVQQTENAYCVVFDEHERVVRTGFFKASESDQLIAILERWLKVPPGQRQDDSPRPSR